MRVDQTHGHEKTVVRNSVHAYTAVVVFNVFYQPLDGIVGIRALIGSVWLRVAVQRAEHLKCSLGAVAPAYVLEDKNVAFAEQFRVAANHWAYAIVTR